MCDNLIDILFDSDCNNSFESFYRCSDEIAGPFVSYYAKLSRVLLDDRPSRHTQPRLYVAVTSSYSPTMSSKASDALDTPTTTLGYWNGIRGVIVPIRCMLDYAGVPYRFKSYPYNRDGATHEEGKAHWLADRATLAEEGLPFPNLPYLIDGDVKLTQSLAIMRYLARKHGLDQPDADPKTAARMDMIEAQVNDFRWSLIYHCVGDKYEDLRWNFLETLPGELSRLSQCLGDRRWLMGDRLTYVDFMLYEALDQYALFSDGCLDVVPNLKAYAGRFRNLEPIRRYLASGNFNPWPVLLPNAKRLGVQDELPKALRKS